MNVRPVDLPELRAELADSLSRPSALWFYEDRAKAFQRRHGGQHEPLEYQAMETALLRADDLYFIASEMAELSRAAAESLPEFTLQIEDLPSEYGLAYLAGGAFSTGTKINPIAAFEWWCTGSGIRLNFYGDTELMIRCLTASGSVTDQQVAEHRTAFGRLSPLAAEMLVNFGCEPIEAPPGFEKLIRTFRAMWLLMQQPLARSTEVEPDRAARRRLSRSGHEPRPVRVIELRRPTSGAERGDGSREFHHQWIVRGHWRNHWHPARQVHRPVWIAPHVKGPEGAPMIGGEKVYAWKR